MSNLVLERRDQVNKTPIVNTGGGGMVMLTPPIDEDYWSYRVKLGKRGQAIVGFPKFFTTGIGFAIEDRDPNTNLPWTTDARAILEHIRVNKGRGIPDADCIEAIEMIQAAIEEDGADAS